MFYARPCRLMYSKISASFLKTMGVSSARFEPWTILMPRRWLRLATSALLFQTL